MVCPFLKLRQLHRYPLGVNALPEQLSSLLRRIVREGGIPKDDFDFGQAAPQELGLVVQQGAVGLAGDVMLLDESAIRTALSPAAAAWLRDLRVFLAVDSTNTRMVAAAQSSTVDGCVWLAELQTAGRGRRGRRWLTPFARNIALTLGFAADQSPSQLGGLSLAVGLAVAHLLQSEGAGDAAVKWPNDIYIGDAKVGGVLIEVVTRAAACDCIIGIGLNLDLPENARTGIDQKVTDLKAQGINPNRNLFAAALVSRVVDAANRFKQEGFAPMRTAYDALHLCHGKPVHVIQGNQTHTGQALGVTATGALRVRSGGQTREFTGGEVSLRPGS